MTKRTLALFSIFVLACALRLGGLISRPLWTDEFYTFFQSTGHGREINLLLRSLEKDAEPRFLRAKEFKAFLRCDPGKTAHDVSAGLLETDVHPPFYFWIMHYWLKAFGCDAASARLFSFFCGILAVALFYRLGKMLFGEGAGIWCALFAAVSPFAVRYAQEARSYSLVLVFILLSSVFLVRFEKERSWKDLAGFAACNCLGLGTHYFYVFIAAAHFFYFTLARHSDTPLLRRFYLGFLFSLIGFSSWGWLLMLRGYDFHLVEWIFGYPGAVGKIVAVFAGLGHYLFIPAGGKALFYAAAAVSACFFAWVLATRGLPKRGKPLLFCALMFLLPLCAMLAIDLAQKGALLKQERFWIFAFPGFALFCGLLFSQASGKQRILAAGVLMLMVYSSLGAGRLDFGPVPQNACQWIRQESGAEESAVFIYNIRSAVLSQASCLDDETYLAAVSTPEQLTAAFRQAGERGIRKVFVSCFYHPTESGLMNQLFMEHAEEYSGAFQPKKQSAQGGVRVSEYEDNHRGL
ncbi:MAG: glycosyltransferase family 39 protein [Candidatus Omnitrophica bacterium]|nr:glycosyltransferase family 39 protein [Candidatus Omnitrophota bacterium]